MSPTVTGYAASTLGSLALLLVAWRWPRAGRLLYAVLFVVAGAFNLVTAIRAPQLYVKGFAPLAFPPMNEFIERVLVLAPDVFVGTIALGQLAIAVAIALGRGALLWAGVTGAATFLVAISWLGAGAAFPTNLVLAAGAVLLLRAARPRAAAGSSRRSA